MKSFSPPGCTTAVHPGGELLYTWVYNPCTPGCTEDFLPMKPIVSSLVIKTMLVRSNIVLSTIPVISTDYQRTNKTGA